MSTPFFSSIERQKALVAALEAREGTPFIEGMSTPNVGYDCAHFVRDCMRESGVDVSFFDDYPQISLNYGKFHSESLLLGWLRDAVKTGRLIQLGPRYEDDDIPLLCGDLIGIKQYASANHLAIVENNDWFWHVPRHSCVQKTALSSFNLKSWKFSNIQITARYRILDK
jgi:cell wall-associated NlpC family hydrolase